MEPTPGPAEGRGTLESLRDLAGSTLALLHTRIELAVVELREEGERRKRLALLIAIAAVFLSLALQLVAVFVVILFWDSHRLAAAGAVTILYLAVGIVALARMRRLRSESPPPFEATLREIARDVEALKGRHG